VVVTKRETLVNSDFIARASKFILAGESKKEEKGET